MKLSRKLTPISLAVAIAAGGAVVPRIATAEMSASLDLASMYLYRGENLTPDGPQIAGGIEFSGDTGLYGGVWVTNETGGHETDLYVGFGGAAGDVSYDISYWYYMYPEDGDLSDTSISEIALGLGYGDLAAAFYISNETQGGSDYVYATVDYTMGDYNVLFGTWSYDEDGNDEYSHVTASYSITDNLGMSVSVASSDDGTTEEDPLFMVSYSVPIDMK